MGVLAEPSYRPAWSNCLFWALHQLRREGGYILIRHGHNGFWFHVLWSPDHERVWSYEPLAPLWLIRRYWGTARMASWPLVALAAILLLRYRGEVVEGDVPVLVAEALNTKD